MSTDDDPRSFNWPPSMGLVLGHRFDTFNSKYSPMEELGRGGSGVTRCVIHKESRTSLACKSIRLSSRSTLEDVRHEVRVMRHVAGHPNVLELHDVIEEHNVVHLFTELCRGENLKDRMKKMGRCYTEDETRYIFRQIMKEICYLHNLRVIHNDMSVYNILFLANESESAIKSLILVPLNSLAKMLDRNWGAGWNLLSLLLATKPSERISCLDALRHPFLCGPKWRIDSSIDVIRWGLGSTTVRMAEDYIYGSHQNWLDFLPGRWRLLYCTGRHIGLTLRQPSPRVLIGNAYLTFTRSPESDNSMFLLSSDISFGVMPTSPWPHNKSGNPGNLHIETSVRVATGRRLYLREQESSSISPSSQESVARKISSKKCKGLMSSASRICLHLDTRV